MIKRFTLIALILMHPAAYAISNIERERPAPPPEGWSGRIELSANGKSGNVQEDRYGVSGRTVFKADKNTYFVILSKAQTTARDIKTADETFAHARWIHQRTDDFAVEGFVQWQENEFDNLLSRSLVGGGGRWRVFYAPDRYSFALGIGAFREWERTDLGSFTDHEQRWRVNTYWSYTHQINEQTSWFNTVYFQPSLSDKDDYRVLLDTGLNVQIIGGLSLRVNYNLKYDGAPPKNLAAQPPVDLRRTNSQYSTSFIYQF